MEEVKPQGESTWNKKRIFFAIFLLILLIAGGYLLKTRVLSESSSQPARSVEGASAVEEDNIASEPKINIKEAVREKIDSIRQQASSLNILEIASSSPQVQKILNDVKSLEQYPINQAQEICKKICGL